MVGGRLCCLSYSFTLNAVLLLFVCLLGVEASSCQHIIHKKVGDTVELSSCLPTVGVTSAVWKLRDTKVADKNLIVTNTSTDKFYLNPINFSLTVRKLTLQDSGDFSFVSGVNYKQRETVIVTLQVHEPITKEPNLTVNSTWNNLNKSCTVLLECSSDSDRNVNYNWSVMNQTQSGSRLQFNIKEDRETTFTCTIANFISEKSASKKEKCSNNSASQSLEIKPVFLLSVAVGGCLMIVIIIGIIVVCHCKQKTAAGSDQDDITTYAEVGEVAEVGNAAIKHQHHGSTRSMDPPMSEIKPYSLYETIDNRIHSVTPVTPGPQTVYDKIQMSRVRKASSPYQEI